LLRLDSLQLKFKFDFSVRIDSLNQPKSLWFPK